MVRESLGMRRTVKTVGMTKDEAQRPDGLNRETFYEAVKSAIQKMKTTSAHTSHLRCYAYLPGNQPSDN
jgi:predicted DNA-binding protein (UPF0251 family)